MENQEEALKFHYIVHCALDAVEEKGALGGPWLSCCVLTLHQPLR